LDSKTETLHVYDICKFALGKEEQEKFFNLQAAKRIFLTEDRNENYKILERSKFLFVIFKKFVHWTLTSARWQNCREEILKNC
jgi:hypothetical protein